MRRCFQPGVRHRKRQKRDQGDALAPVGWTWQVADFDGHRAFWFYGKDAWLSLPSPAFDVRIEPVASNEFEVEITARTILRDLHLDEGALGDDARVDANLRSALPGEILTARIRGVSALVEDDLRRPGVLRTANDCGPAGEGRGA